MKSNNGHLASHWKLGNSAQGRLTLSHMTQGASQWPWKRAQWDPGRLQAPWNVVKRWFKRETVFFGRGGGGIDRGRWVRVPTQPNGEGVERESKRERERERARERERERARERESERERASERERGPCLVTVETSPDTPPGRAAKIISASWGVHKHERRAQEAGPWVLSASQAFFSLFSSLPAAPPPLFCSFSFYPFLHAAVFQSVCSGCLGQGAGGEEAKDLACSFSNPFLHRKGCLKCVSTLFRLSFSTFWFDSMGWWRREQNQYLVLRVLYWSCGWNLNVKPLWEPRVPKTFQCFCGKKLCRAATIDHFHLPPLCWLLSRLKVAKVILAKNSWC